MKRLAIFVILVVALVVFTGSSFSEEVLEEKINFCQIRGLDSGKYITPSLMAEQFQKQLGYYPKYCFYDDDRCIEVYLLNTRVLITNVSYDKNFNKLLIPEFEIPCEVVEQNEIISENVEDRYYISEINSDDFTIGSIAERKDGLLSVSIISHLPDEDGKSFNVLVHSADYEEECADYRIPKSEFMQLWYEVYGI